MNAKQVEDLSERPPNLPLAAEQQSLPFPTVVCCHDLLLSV